MKVTAIIPDLPGLVNPIRVLMSSVVRRLPNTFLTVAIIEGAALRDNVLIHAEMTKCCSERPACAFYNGDRAALFTGRGYLDNGTLQLGLLRVFGRKTTLRDRPLAILGPTVRPARLWW